MILVIIRFLGLPFVMKLCGMMGAIFIVVAGICTAGMHDDG